MRPSDGGLRVVQLYNDRKETMIIHVSTIDINIAYQQLSFSYYEECYDISD